jgi:hypothetical protein
MHATQIIAIATFQDDLEAVFYVKPYFDFDRILAPLIADVKYST